MALFCVIKIFKSYSQAGSHHFYIENEVAHWKDSEGVNALKRAYIISTVPPQKPSVYAASQTHFCRYLTEYSENAHFRPHFLVHINLGIIIPVFRPFVKPNFGPAVYRWHKIN